MGIDIEKAEVTGVESFDFFGYQIAGLYKGQDADDSQFVLFDERFHRCQTIFGINGM